MVVSSASFIFVDSRQAVAGAGIVSFDRLMGYMILSRIRQSILTNEADAGAICPLTNLTADEAPEFA